MATHKGSIKRRLIASACLFLALIALYEIAFPFFARPGGPTANISENGLWLGDSWYSALATSPQITALAAELQSRQIRYAYVRVGSIDAGGHLRLHYLQNARQLIGALHRDAPAVKVIAWVYAGNERGLGRVDLSNSSVRDSMAGGAAWLTKDCGFDGIQWDYEICPDGDPDFLALLAQTRNAMPAGKILSVATPMWLPAPLRSWGWSDAYFGKVCALCDQVDVMCYDSGVWWPSGYVDIVADQAAHVTAAATKANPRCAVLLGVPTYVRGGLSHDPYAENLRLALIGVRDGLASSDARPAAFAGVAVFADYTTKPADWRTYAELWPPARRTAID